MHHHHSHHRRSEHPPVSDGSLPNVPIVAWLRVHVLCFVSTGVVLIRQPTSSQATLLLQPDPVQLRISQRGQHPRGEAESAVCMQVKADYSNLEGVVKALLGNPARMQRIADTAYQSLVAHSQVLPPAPSAPSPPSPFPAIAAVRRTPCSQGVLELWQQAPPVMAFVGGRRRSRWLTTWRRPSWTSSRPSSRTRSWTLTPSEPCAAALPLGRSLRLCRTYHPANRASSVCWPPVAVSAQTCSATID